MFMFLFFMARQPLWVWASTSLRFQITLWHTSLGRISLDEWSTPLPQRPVPDDTHTHTHKKLVFQLIYKPRFFFHASLITTLVNLRATLGSYQYSLQDSDFSWYIPEDGYSSGYYVWATGRALQVSSFDFLQRKAIFLLRSVPTVSGAHPVSCSKRAGYW